MRAHPAADLFPLMTDDELAKLADDIRAQGQLVPIVTHDGLILDGRNRWLACERAGVTPRTVAWTGQGSPAMWVISMNLQRRHLTPSQRAAIAVDVLPLLEREARGRQRAAAEQTNLALGRQAAETLPEKLPEASEARSQAAAVFSINPHYVSDAKKLKAAAPDLYDAVRAGEQTITEAKRELKERGREQVREQNRALVEAAPPAITVLAQAEHYQTIVLDPPWDWGDEGDVDQFGRARPTYATMPLDDVAALPVADLAADNAHIYLWITNRSLPKGFALLERWGFRYVTALTWVKPSFGMGNYFRGSTEHVLFGVRGSLALLRQDAPTHFLAPRPGEHSAKPDAFYGLVESCSPGPWLEMFSRKARNGWVAWGAEVVADGR